MAGLRQSQEPAPSLAMPGGFDQSYSVDDVRAQMTRIMTSAEFNRSPRLRRFLQFIVDESLCGREGQIKAYTIGVAVCDRDDQFDPSIDPIVRIEAGRLRRALEHYYLTQGAHDPIAIDVPKGAYRPLITGKAELYQPEFYIPENSSSGQPQDVLQRLPEEGPAHQVRPAAPEPASFLHRLTKDAKPAWFVAAVAVMSFGIAVSLMDKAPSGDEKGIRLSAPATSGELGFWRMPTLLVLPFHSDDGDAEQSSAADVVTDGITQYLMQQTDLVVRRASSGNGGFISSLYTNLYETFPIDFVVSGSVRKVDNYIRISVQLTNVGAEASVWSQNYDGEIQGDRIGQEHDIARSIVAQVAKLSMRAAPASR